METPEFLGATWRDGLALAVAAKHAGLDTPVRSCPGWSVADLVHHIGEVHWFWAEDVANGWDSPAAYVEPERPADADLLSWYRSGVDHTLGVLRQSDPLQSVWSWAPRGGTVGWIIRRMAQETAVHRWDAEDAAGTEWAIDATLAVDGVDEFLDHFTDTGAEGAEPVGGTVHLHCTDPSMREGAGEWLITEPVVGGRLEVTREHAKGDAAVRGTASDLLLALWRRRTLDETDRFEVFGDADVARRLLARGARWADLRFGGVGDTMRAAVLTGPDGSRCRTSRCPCSGETTSWSRSSTAASAAATCTSSSRAGARPGTSRPRVDGGRRRRRRRPPRW